MKIAIVGFGLSGASLLRALMDHAPKNTEFNIDIYESQDQLSRGPAYAKNNETPLMNTMARYLSVDRLQPMDFVNWLSNQQNKKVDPNSFVPRSIYGQYLDSHFKKYYTSEKVFVIQEEIIKVNLIDTRLQLLSDSGREEIYDDVFLAIGHPPYADYYNLIGEDYYIHDPYPLRKKLAEIPKDASIGIIGSGLTAVDVARSLIHDHNWSKPITFYIPEHPFNTVAMPWEGKELDINLTQEWINSFPNFVPLDQVVTRFVQDMENNNIDIKELLNNFMTGSHTEILYQLENYIPDLAKMQRYQESIKYLMPEIFNRLSKSDQYKLKKVYSPYIDHFRKVMPLKSLTDIYKWVKEGKVKFISGINSINKVENHFELTINSGQSFKENWMINSSGFQFNPFMAKNLPPLLLNLLNESILTPHAQGGFIVSYPTSQLISNRYGKIDNLYLLGPWIASTLYTANDAQISMLHGDRAGKLFWESSC